MSSTKDMNESEGRKEMTESQAHKSGKDSQSAISRDLAMPPSSKIEVHPPRITFCDMKVDMKQYACETAEIIFRVMTKGDKKYYFRDAAQYIKDEFDKKFKPTWHVIVGTNFGSFVSFEAKHVILVWINNVGFLIWKHG